MKRSVIRQKKLKASPKKGRGNISGKLTWANLKRAAIYFYVLVVGITSYGLYSVLQSDTLPPDTLDKVAPSDNVDLVLRSMNREERIQPPAENHDSIVEIQVKPAWRLNAATWSAAVTTPVVAVVIDDLGLSQAATHTLANMPGPYTLAFLPYADDLPEQTGYVKAAGHELMVHMPMQPKNREADPGFNALLSSLGREEFERRVVWNLSRFDGYVGVNNHMGSELTENAGAMVRVMEKLREDGHLFLDSLTSPKSVGVRAARATGVPYISRDIFLDNVREEQAIAQQLAKLERIAQMRGYAVAIGHPYDITLESLTKWQKTLEKKKITMVPLSQIVAMLEAARHSAETAR